jgi:Domain of Unknown Function (DUF1080)
MKILTLAAVAVILFSCNASESSSEVKTDSLSAPVPAADTSGWISLFDGKTTNGWHTYGSPGVNSRWKITDSAVAIDTSSKESGDIVTNEEYENFHLQVEWKIAPKGNSGIIFLVKEDTAKYHQTYVTGPEMQVLS